MTATATTASGEVLAPRTVSIARGYRFELVKLLAQWRVRILIGLCWIGPAVTVVVASGQSTLPADTLFGREMHATGWAGALVVLAFAGSWLFPLLTSVVAGDVFSSEDRLGTWRHLLVAVRSPRRIFIAKSLASLTVLLMCVPDGTQLWVGRNNGYTKFTVNSDGSLSNPVQISIPAQGGKEALVGKAVFSPDGSTVYAAVNGQNTVVAIDAATGAIEQTWNVGNAPRDRSRSSASP
jgi:YVTN family beta-propeller protein